MGTAVVGCPSTPGPDRLSLQEFAPRQYQDLASTLSWLGSWGLEEEIEIFFCLPEAEFIGLQRVVDDFGGTEA